MIQMAPRVSKTLLVTLCHAISHSSSWLSLGLPCNPFSRDLDVFLWEIANLLEAANRNPLAKLEPTHRTVNKFSEDKVILRDYRPINYLHLLKGGPQS